ncbi:MAG: adenylate cyclase [Gammaproteobacteria bacterium HGW-Gammaproteobacteria-14]|nr:MAG: adenylate cyclase [Gammaproteobacteria bacterium HGW-Gammaproteobacteria-14]
MATEIERKFLVRNSSFLTALSGQVLRQGYLSHSTQATVRVRIAGDQGFLTIKGQNNGISRAEFEYPIPLDDAEALLALCQSRRIDKTRYRIPVDQHLWEVDVFAGDNAGLIVAEIELGDETETFTRPDWLGNEVSDDPRYFNSQLSQHPYCQWRD